MVIALTIFTIKAFQASQALEPVDIVEEEIALEPAELSYIEARWSETSIHARPWVPGKRIATLEKGTRLVVRGQVASRDQRGCHGKPWYAVYPFGFVCSDQVRPTQLPPEPGKSLELTSNQRVPFSYMVVLTDGATMYENVDAVHTLTPLRSLSKGMSLAIRQKVVIEDHEYMQTLAGHLVPKAELGWMGQGSEWSGTVFDEEIIEKRGPVFAWVTFAKTPVYQQADVKSARVHTLPRRAKIPLLESSEQNDKRWWRIDENQWVLADQLNEVSFVVPPAEVLAGARQSQRGNDQWIDIDLGEQVLVAYRGKTPVYATLISSGRGHPTPRGNYPIWAKVATTTMDNQDYEDNPYMVQQVPWVLFFQGHNAIHGAYWHDRFGERKSHGCVNLSPLDARWLFEWVGPTLPKGWTGYLPSDLDRSVIVHVRDSSRATGETFKQERPIGPPDPDEERRKRKAAEKRREAMSSSLPNLQDL